MNGILKALPMLFTFLVSYIILIQIDKKYSLIIRIDSKLKIKTLHPLTLYENVQGLFLNLMNYFY